MWPGFTYSMPIPEIDGPENYSDKRFLERAILQFTWCLLPRRCGVSGRWMFLTKAYCAKYVISGPGDPAIWTRWYSDAEMLVLKLKGC